MNRIRLRLKEEELQFLGIADRNQTTKYRITTEQHTLLTIYRKNKGVVDACNEMDVDVRSARTLWLKSKETSVNVKNPLYSDRESAEFETLRKLIIEEVRHYAPIYRKVELQDSLQDPHCILISPADVHIGKLVSSFEVGVRYNSQIAVQRTLDGVQGILSKSAPYNIEEYILVIGNDILHIDTPKRQTTSGTPQDTDGMWYDNFLLAKRLYVDIIEMLLSRGQRVKVVYNPSNHDYTNGFFLAQVIEAHFSNCPNIDFQVNISHRKYVKYGNNLIGTTHGDGAKMLDLDRLMANEVPQLWAECKHRYVYTHHLHHKWSKDVMSVTIEGMRSPSEADSWHHRNGYQHSPKAIEGFIHHKLHGQVSRITHLF